MLLYTNGCSHTAGDDRALGPDHGLKVWPYHLFTHMTAGKDGTHNLINRAIGGNNNQLLSSRVIRDLQDFKPDYAVIQFTHANRFWTPGHSHQPNGDHVPPTFLQTGEIRETSDKDTVNKNFYDMYYMSRFAYVECTNQMLTTIKYVETLLKSIDVPYTFIVWPKILDANYDSFENTLDHSRILNYYQGRYYPIRKILSTYGIEFPEDNQHYEEPGQQAIADAVHRHITDGTKFIPKHKISSDPHPEDFIDSVY